MTKKSLEKQLRDDLPLWRDLNQINISEFGRRTSPLYYIRSCELNQVDCRLAWKPRQTYLGFCLELNPNDLLDQWKKVSRVVQVVRVNAFVALESFRDQMISQ